MTKKREKICMPNDFAMIRLLEAHIVKLFWSRGSSILWEKRKVFRTLPDKAVPKSIIRINSVR